MGHVDVYFSADPSNHQGTYANRGGPMDPVTNFCLSLSIEPPPRIFAKQQKGFARFSMAKKPGESIFGLDATGFVVDSSESEARIRVRFAKNAASGLWVLKSYLSNTRHERSCPAVRILELQDHGRAESNMPWKGFALAISFGMVLAVWTIILFRNQRKAIRIASEESEGATPHTPDKELEINSTQRKRIEDAIQYVKVNYGKPISSKDVAEAINISANRLGKVFHQGTGITLNRYINEFKIGKAKEFLKDSSLTVTEVAYKIGYNSLDHFFRVFRTQEGVSPKKWRESQ